MNPQQSPHHPKQLLGEKPTDNLPPHDEDMERALLGCVFLNPAIVIPELMSAAVPEHFYVLEHRYTYLACVDLYSNNRAVDVITVKANLARLFPGDEISTHFLSSLTEYATSAHNWPVYLEKLNELLIQRRILAHCTEYTSKSMRPYAENLLDTFESDSLSIGKALRPGRDFADFPAIHKQLMDDYQEALENGKPPGISTGFPDLDHLIGGLNPQEMIVLAGSPSAGKTSLALAIAMHVALDKGIHVGMVSLETSARKIIHRITCSVSRVNGTKLLTGQPTQKDLQSLVSNAGTVAKFGRHFQLSDRGGISAPQAASMFRMMYQKGARLFILDYLQLLSSGKNSSRRIEEMTIVSTMLKGIAKELDCPLICISSLNREAMKEGRAPRLSDLRETGQLEYDADKVILLHPQDESEDVRAIHVHVAKNKEGPIGKCTLMFLPQSLRYESSAKITDADSPHPYTDI